MRTSRYAFLSVLGLFLSIILAAAAASSAYAQNPLQFVPATPCRVVDTRNPDGPFGGPTIQGGTERDFALPSSPDCSIPSSAVAYSLNVTVVPNGNPLGYLTVWPAGQNQPGVSTTNSLDGRTKANAAIVPAGTNGAISVFASNTTDVVLDIDGYFVQAAPSALAFYPVTPCRVADTRSTGNPLEGGMPQDFAIQGNTCPDIPATATAYSLNFTAVPNGNPLGYLTVWPAGQPQPGVSTLNALTGTTTANAAVVPAGANGDISAFASNTTDLVIDINGYFGPPGGPGQLALYTLTPCRVLDTRPNGQFVNELTVVVQGTCGVPAGAGAYVLNATVVPPGPLGYLTLWPDGAQQPVVSTLNALDGTDTSNMAIVPTTNGSIDAFASNPTQLVVDIFSLMAPLPTLMVTTTTLPNGQVGQTYPPSQLTAAGGVPPYSWTVTSGTFPPGLGLDTTGLITGMPTMAGVFNFTVQVTDSESNTGSAPLQITIQSSTLTITTTSLPNGQVMVPYDATLGVAGGTPPYMWSIVQGTGTLPAGLMLDAGSGLISGTPTAAGVSNFTVQVQDSQQQIAQAPLQIVIDAATTNGALNGHYAFSFNGYQNGTAVFMAGSFIADGNGNITSGVLDLNLGTGTPHGGAALTGTYTITADGLGTMTFHTISTILNFHVTVSTGGNGQLIQDNQDPSQRGSGSFFVQTTTDFIPPTAGNYGIGSFGADATFNRYAKAGALQVASAGAVPSGTEDVNDNGTLSNRQFSGTFFIPDPRTGRGQVAFSFPNGVTNNYAYYIVSRAQFILVGTDSLSANDPLTLGSVLPQMSGSFNNGSLNGTTVIEANGLAPNGGSPLADITLGLFTADGNGNAIFHFDENRGGTVTQQSAQGTYSVASNGKVTLSGFGSGAPILYLTTSNQAFVLGQDNSVSSGILEPQLGPPPFNNLSIFGTYLGGTISPVESPVIDAVNFLFADGNGNINGIQDFSAPSGSGTANLAATYQVDATGRAILTGTPAGIMYVVSDKKIVLLPTDTNNPALSVFSSGLTN